MSVMLRWRWDQHFLKKHSTCSKIFMLLIELPQKIRESARKPTVSQSQWDNLKLSLEFLKQLQRSISRALCRLSMLKKLTDFSGFQHSTQQTVECKVINRERRLKNSKSYAERSKKPSREESPLEPRFRTPSFSKKWWWDSRTAKLSIMLSSRWSKRESSSIKKQERSSAGNLVMFEYEELKLASWYRNFTNRDKAKKADIFDNVYIIYLSADIYILQTIINYV